MANAQFLLAHRGWNAGAEAVDADGVDCAPLSEDAARFCVVGAIKRSIADMRYSLSYRMGVEDGAQRVLERFVEAVNLKLEEGPLPGEPYSDEHLGVAFWQDNASERAVADKITEAIISVKGRG